MNKVLKADGTALPVRHGAAGRSVWWEGQRGQRTGAGHPRALVWS